MLFKGFRTKIDSDFATALTIAASHFFLLLLLQIESYFLFLFKKEDGLKEIFRFLSDFSLGQFGALFISILLAFLFFVLKKNRFTRVLIFTSLFFLNFYLLVDQMIFRLFFKHFRPSLNEGRFIPEKQMYSTFIDEIDLRFLVNFAVLILLTSILYLNIIQQRLFFWQRLIRFPRKTYIAGLSAYFIFSGAYYHFSDIHDLFQHPIVSLFEQRSDFQKDNAKPRYLSQDLYQVTFSEGQSDGHLEKDIRKTLEQFQKNHKKPNILLIVLESVGSDLLFSNDGDLSPEVTPFLHSLRQKSLYFPTLYAIHPTTSLSHVSLQTGGYGLTWGNIFIGLDHPYVDQTLPSQFKESGYATAMISSGTLHDGNLNSFYRHLKYDYHFDFGDQKADFKNVYQNGPWGGHDDLLWTQLEKFLDTNRTMARQPFFAQLTTISTHYPYVVPQGFKGIRHGKTDYEKFVNSLKYTDEVISKIFSSLSKMNRLENTLIFITGDHGEAFGDIHRNNLLHNQAIYDENIKSFLIAIDPQGKFSGPLVSSIVATNGDIMPTLLSLAGIKPPKVLGQDISSPQFEPRRVFFHKKTYPAQCGLRDGKWKFFYNIEEIDHQNAQLFNLEVDSGEQKNVAEMYPDFVQKFKDICSHWYYAMEDEFHRRTKREEGSVVEMARGSGKPTAFRIVVRDDQDVFHEMKSPRPYERLMFQTTWEESREDKEITYLVTSPTGLKYQATQTKYTDWVYLNVYIPVPLPLEVGKWTVQINHKDTELIKREFTVHEEWSDQILKKEGPGPLMAVLGRQDKYSFFHQADGVKLQRINPYQEDLRVNALWSPYSTTKKVRLEWSSPRKVESAYDFTLQPGWANTYNYLSIPRPLLNGKWTLKIKDGDHEMLTKHFVVDPEAPLLGDN
ncbi:MAG: hypothetical protein BroJett040_21060 [Oligoflexia bacterium]|nr:MAG: hypothetical protein BroJett040_21060 [Oligoflexia bacterium]